MSIFGDGDMQTHVLLFPFPSSGHIIPLLDLANTLLSRCITITILITPSNLPLLKPLQLIYSHDFLRALVLSFPDASVSGLPALIRASSQLHGPILEWFQSQPSPPVAIISDFFLGWTQNLATQLGIPRILFWPSGAMSCLILFELWGNLSKFLDPADETSLISFPSIPKSPAFPLWQVAEYPRRFVKGDSDWEFLKEGFLVNAQSWGSIFNTFAELEESFIDRVKKEMGHDRIWAVGPLFLNHLDSRNRGGSSMVSPHQVMKWLDDKAADSVLYVCFGSRSILTSQQAGSLAAALECSGVPFIWRLDGFIPEGFEDRVANRGLILKRWAPQVSILRHAAVGAFLTHCGWNSSIEGLASGVLMLTWPLDADQFINARLLVDDLGVAIRACEGGTRTIPDPAELAKIFSESLRNDQPKKALAKKLRDAASEAVQSEGSSRKDTDALIKQLNILSCK